MPDPGPDPIRAVHRPSPARVAGAYLFFGLAWIWFSDLGLIRLGIGGESGVRAGALTGTGFVLVAAAVLYLLVRREVRHLTGALGLLRAVIDGTADAVVVKDRDGKYLLVNAAAAAFLGRPAGDLLGRAHAELFDAQGAASVAAHDRRVMESGRAEAHEGELTAAGATRTFQSTGVPYRDASGRVIGVVVVSRDVTDRKRADAALRASEERYRALVELAPEAIVLTRDDRVAFANAAAARLIGAAHPAALVGLCITDHVHPDELPATRERQAAVIQRGEVLAPHEIRIRCLDGTYVDVEACSGPCTIDGTPGVQLIGRDVTERKRGAAFLARQTAVLERIATGAPLPGVLDEVARMVEDQLPGAVASILLLDRDGGHLRLGAAPHLPPEYNAAIDGVAIGPRAGSCGTAAYTREPVLVNDIAADPLWAGYKHLALAQGLRACWSVPIFAAPRGTDPPAVLGTFAVYGRRPGAPDPRFAELLGRAGHLASIALESARAARDLRESEGLYRALVESSADGIFVHDGHRITYANPALLRLLGADAPERVLGRDPFELLHPDDRAFARERFRRMRETAQPVTFAELRYVRPDGTPVDVETAGVPFERGGVLTIHVTTRDVTARKRAERALREREEQLRTFVDHVWAPIAMLDRDLRYIYTSRRWLTEYRLDADGVIGRNHYEVVPDLPDRWKRVYERCLAGAVERCEEDRFARADGTAQWTRWEVRPWRQPDGAIGGIVIFSEDITVRKRAEEALRQSETRYRMISELTSDYVYSLRLRGAPGADPFDDAECEWITQSFAAITGYEWSEVPALGGWGRVVHADDLPELRRSHARLLAGRSGVAEYRVRRKDGGVRWLRDHFRPVWDEGAGRVVRVYGAVQDVTERRDLEDQLRQAQKMEAVGRLAGGVAHDFNNLLTVINGFCDLVLRELRPDDPHRDALGHVRAAGDRAARLTQQLLVYGRKALVEPTVLDLNELVTESTRLLRRLIGEDVAVTNVLQPGLDRIKVDRGQIEQVLMNLAINARDAMPRGGRITIETRAVDRDRSGPPDDPAVGPGRYVRLTVSDTGTGMTEEVKARIFEPFFTTKEQGKGTGLGLSMVYGAVEQCGGHIGVTSAPGAGTTFVLLFPAAEPAAPALSGVIRRSARGSETILLVEDEDAVRAIARIGLEREGYTVLTADSGPDALDRVAGLGRAIDLLLTDVVMPQMGGRQLAETLRARQPGLRVLYMSGYTDDVVVRHELAAAPGAFLQKPFTPMELARKVRDILDGRS